MLVILTTVPTAEEAENLAKGLIEAKLTACVQVVPQIKSFYKWEGKVQSDHEQLLLIKSLEAQFPSVEKYIEKNHSYDVPEIVALRSENVGGKYLEWVNGVLK